MFDSVYLGERTFAQESFYRVTSLDAHAFFKYTHNLDPVLFKSTMQNQNYRLDIIADSILSFSFLFYIEWTHTATDLLLNIRNKFISLDSGDRETDHSRK